MAAIAEVRIDRADVAKPDDPLIEFDINTDESEIRRRLLAMKLWYAIGPEECAVTTEDLFHARGASFEEMEAMRAELTTLGYPGTIETAAEAEVSTPGFGGFVLSQVVRAA